MADYIQPGQKITAQWLNSIVDQANGNIQPYTEGVIQTPNGPLMRNWSPNNAYDTPLYQLHQVRMGPAQTLFGNNENEVGLSGVVQHMWIHLGRSFLGWRSSFQIDPYYIDRGMFAVLDENDVLQFFPINQNSFNLNDLSTTANECKTVNDVVNCEEDTNGTIHDYSGWVETPFNLSTDWTSTTDSNGTLFCHLIDMFLPGLEESTKSTSQYVAAVYTNIPPTQFNSYMNIPAIAENIKQKIGAAPHSIIYSARICDRSVDEKLAPGTNTTTLPHIHQLMTGPIVAKFQPMQELVPTFIMRFAITGQGQKFIADASFPLTTPRVERDVTDDGMDFYLGVDEWTVGGLPVYIKVDQVCLYEGTTPHIYESNSAPTDPNATYIQYEDVGFSTTYTGILKIRNAFQRTMDTKIQEGQRWAAPCVDGKLVCWAIPQWNAKINKWVVNLQFNENLDAPDLPSSPATDQPFAEAWCLGWTGCSVIELGTITHSKITGSVQGTLTMPLADSQLGRRTSNAYEDLDNGENIYKSLGYEKSNMTVRPSIKHNLSEVQESYDYTPIELYKFNSSDFYNQPTITQALNNEKKKISFVCRVENDSEDESITGKDVKIEYFKAQLGGGGDSKTPDADAFAQTGQRSTESLSSDYLQIYGFDRLSVNNDLTSYQYGLIARNEATKEVEYLALSALSAELSGECLSAQGNLSTSVAVDCKGKLLKFDAGLSSNVEIDIVENNPGIVDVKIGVYYI